MLETFTVSIVFIHTAQKNLKKPESVCNDHDYCYAEMPNEENKILEYHQGEESLKVLFMIYADLQVLLE